MADTPPETDGTLADLVREKHAQLKAGDHFALLGIPRSADAATIKTAYFQLAKQLHPDVVARQNVPELSRQSVDVFRGLSEAFATLTDRRRRAEYEARTADGKAPATAEEKTRRDAASEARIWFHKGTILMQRRATSEAEACFRKAVELDRQNPKLLDALGWAVMNNESKPLEPRLEEARQWFEKALESPQQDTSGDPHYYLALYFKAKGDTVRQRQSLQDALNVNDRNVEALREQRLMAMRARRKNDSPLMQSLQKLISRYAPKKQGSR